MSSESFEQLLLRIYGAAIEPGAWESVLIAVADRSGALGCMLGMLHPEKPERAWGALGRLDRDVMGRFLDSFQDDIPIQRFNGIAETNAVYGHRFMQRQELHSTPIYQELMRPYSIEGFVLLPLLQNSQFAHVGVGMMFDEFEVEPEPAQRQLIERLAPHLKLAVVTVQKLARANAVADLLGEALERAPGAVLAVDPDGGVMFANGAAQRLLRAQDGLAVVGDRLALADAAATKRLRRLIAQASRTSLGVGTEPGGAFRAERPSGEEPLRVVVAPTADRRPFGPGGRPTAFVFVSDGSRPANGHALPTLQALYDLTPTEARVAVAIARGDGLAQVAAALRIAHETARTHLKHVFDKTGARSQLRLANLVNGIGG